MPLECRRTLGCLIESFHCSKFFMNHGTPSDKNISNVLDPSEFETPTPFSPFRIIITLDNASGVQLPAAKNVKPITASGMRNV